MQKSKFLLILLLPFVFSCSKTEKTEESGVPTISKHVEVQPEPKAPEIPDPAQLANEGKALVESADCMSCHQISEKMIGPAYKDVANKYSEKDVDLLVDKIINGGSGNWGNVPMAAHNGLSQENSRKMVYYILSLK